MVHPPHSWQAAAHAAQASTAAVGSRLLGGLASLSGDRNLNWDLTGVWRAYRRGAQGPSPALWQGHLSSVEVNMEMQVTNVLKH